jgi:hypothetical protein
MALSTSKKVTAARAKPTTTKSTSKSLKKNKQIMKNSQSQASVASSSHSQTTRHISVSDEDKEPTHIGGVLDVNNDIIMEPSDGKEHMIGTKNNPTEKSNNSEDEEGEEDEEAELHKTLP